MDKERRDRGTVFGFMLTKLEICTRLFKKKQRLRLNIHIYECINFAVTHHEPLAALNVTLLRVLDLLL